MKVIIPNKMNQLRPLTPGTFRRPLMPSFYNLPAGGGCTAMTNTIEAQFPATGIRTSLKYIIFISKIAFTSIEINLY